MNNGEYHFQFAKSYEDGIGVKQKRAKRIKYFEKSAEENYSKGAYTVGWFY